MKNVRTPPEEFFGLTLTHRWKVHSVGYNFVTYITVYLHSFSHCCLPKSRNHAKLINIWRYSSSRSSKGINLVVNWKLICDFLL